MIACHGFGYPVGVPTDFVEVWNAALSEQVEALDWYSCPPGIAAVLKAWANGHTDRYSYAYRQLAPAAAEALASLLTGATSGNIVCHSLGARVVLMAMNILGDLWPRGRVLICDGAELQDEAPYHLPAGVNVLNVCVRSDRVLTDLGSIFSGDGINGCIGRDGLGRKMAGWNDIWLDDLSMQAKVLKARNWKLTGATPTVDGRLYVWGDHWSYENSLNWPLFSAWMKGDTLADIL